MKRLVPILSLIVVAHSVAASPILTIDALNAARNRPDQPREFSLSGRVYMTWPSDMFLLVNGSSGIVLRAPWGRCPSRDKAIRVCGTDGHSPDTVHTPWVSSIDTTAETIPVDPLSAGIADVLDGKVDYRFIRIEGIVIDAATDEISYGYIQLILMDKGRTVSVSTHMKTPDPTWVSRLRNARISVTGLCDPRVGSLRHLHRRGILTRPDGIRVLADASADGKHILSLENIGLTDYEKVSSLYDRYRIDGHVTAVWHGDRLLVTTTNGLNAQVVLARGLKPPVAGSFIRAIGYPETDLYTINLASSVWHPEETSAIAAEQTPIPLTADTLFLNKNGHVQFDAQYHCKAVSIRGQVLNIPDRNLGETAMHLNSNGSVISVDIGPIADPLKDVLIGSTVEVTGICLLDTENWRPSVPFPRAKGAFIVTRRTDDIRILAHPPWWTPVRLAVVIGSLLAILIAILVWNRILQQLVERRGRQLFREQIARTASELKTEERTRLAVELHDAMSQNISSATLQINAAERLAATDREKERHHLQIAAKTLQSCREELRNCIWDLRNQSFDEPDLNKAIARMLHVLVEGIELSIRFDVPRTRLSDNTVHTILKTIRELVVNAVRHGKAHSVKIDGTLDGGQIVFSVTDDGTGFDPDNCPGIANGHFGLQGIRERVRQLQGTLEIKSAPNVGTRVVITLNAPVPKTEDKDTL